MTRPSRLLKRLIVPALLVAALIGVQVVVAAPPQPGFTAVGPNFTTTCGVWQFDSTATDPDGDIDLITWDLAGTPATGNSVQATFASPGPRTINMSARDTDAVDGAVDTIDATPQTVQVGNGGPPTAAFTATPQTAEPNQTITFNAGSSSAQGGGSIARYEWDLNGDNTFETDTGATPTATQAYATTGFHAVNLRVTDNCNVPDTTSPGTGVFVQNTAPTASFTITPNPAAIGVPVTFDGSASADTGGGAITKWEWDLDGNGSFETDTTASATPSQATRTYTAAGTYFVKLRVTDSTGTSTTAFEPSLRVNAKPVANFTITPPDPVINQPVSFDGSASADPDGTVTTYEWDLDGDGTFEATGVNPTHTYADPGTFSVKLRVTDGDNTQSDVLQRPLTVQATKPSAGFTYTPHDPLPGQAVTLTSTSTPSASPGAPSLVATQWDFGYSPLVDFTLDGAGASIVTSFANAGPHPVAVKVTESGGGFAIHTDTIVVNAAPSASFTVSPSKPKEGRSVTFASTSSDAEGPLATQEWDFNNDGKVDRTGPVATTSNLRAGRRTVALRVTDSKGAQSTSTQTIAVAKKDLGPPPDVVSSVSYSPRRWGIVLASFTVKVPSQTSVAVSCKGRGCPRGTFRKRSKKKGARLAFPAIHGSLRAGVKINIVFSKPGRLTGWDVITVRGDKRRTVLREGCKLPGFKKQKRCP